MLGFVPQPNLRERRDRTQAIAPVQASLIHVIVGVRFTSPLPLAMFRSRIPSRMAELLECAGSLDLLLLR